MIPLFCSTGTFKDVQLITKLTSVIKLRQIRYVTYMKLIIYLIERLQAAQWKKDPESEYVNIFKPKLTNPEDLLLKGLSFH